MPHSFVPQFEDFDFKSHIAEILRMEKQKKIQKIKDRIYKKRLQGALNPSLPKRKK